jgi:hypothetical protein
MPKCEKGMVGEVHVEWLQPSSLHGKKQGDEVEDYSKKR